MPLSDTDINKVSQRTVELLRAEHICNFPEEERKMVHSLYDTMQQEKANNGIWRPIILWGMGMQNTGRRVVMVASASIIIVTLSFFGAKGLPWIVKLLGETK